MILNGFIKNFPKNSKMKTALTISFINPSKFKSPFPQPYSYAKQSKIKKMSSDKIISNFLFILKIRYNGKKSTAVNKSVTHKISTKYPMSKTPGSVPVAILPEKNVLNLSSKNSNTKKNTIYLVNRNKRIRINDGRFVGIQALKV